VLNDLSDEQLMLRYQQSDAQAYEELLNRYYRPIFRYLLRSLRNREAAEDLLQDVFMRVIRGAKGYRQRAKFSTWLYTIARNTMIDATRKRRFRNHQSLDQPIGNDTDTGRMNRVDLVKDEHPHGKGDRSLADKQFTESLQEALNRLNPEQREVFLLREFQNLSFSEISELVKAPENTVKSRMRYALEFLREALSDYAEEPA